MKSERTPEFSLVVPTLNEAANIVRLIPRLRSVLGDFYGGAPSYEILVVDDASDDGTADAAEAEAVRSGGTVRVIRRAPPFGLGHAILEGFDAARGRILGVIDADMQHDEGILPLLLSGMARHDLAIGSRYSGAGRVSGWSRVREFESRFAAAVTRGALGLSVFDPLSGFFLSSRALYAGVRDRLRPESWKILLEILAAAPGASVSEVPYTFGARERGETKMTWRVARDWLKQLRRLRRSARRSVLRPAIGAAGGAVGTVPGKAGVS